MGGREGGGELRTGCRASAAQTEATKIGLFLKLKIPDLVGNIIGGKPFKNLFFALYI